MDTRRLTRRTLLRGAALGGTGLLAAYFVGCSDDDDDNGGADGGTSTLAPTAAPTITLAPSTPADEAKEFALVDGWYRGEAVRYYDFGMNSPVSGGTVATAPIWVLITGVDASGMPIFVEGQHNIVDAIPGDTAYSDLWQVQMVTVPEDYAPDSITSAAGIEDAEFEVTVTDMFVNCPVIPAGSALEGGEPLVQGWYKDQEVFYPDFGANPATALPIFVMITGMDASGMPVFVEGQGNIIDSVPIDDGYSAFWQVNMVTVPEDYEANTLKSADDVASSGYDTQQTDMVVNCPVTVF